MDRLLVHHGHSSLGSQGSGDLGCIPRDLPSDTPEVWPRVTLGGGVRGRPVPDVSPIASPPPIPTRVPTPTISTLSPPHVHSTTGLEDWRKKRERESGCQVGVPWPKMAPRVSRLKTSILVPTQVSAQCTQQIHIQIISCVYIYMCMYIYIYVYAIIYLYSDGTTWAQQKLENSAISRRPGTKMVSSCVMTSLWAGGPGEDLLFGYGRWAFQANHHFYHRAILSPEQCNQKICVYNICMHIYIYIWYGFISHEDFAMRTTLKVLHGRCAEKIHA